MLKPLLWFCRSMKKEYILYFCAKQTFYYPLENAGSISTTSFPLHHIVIATLPIHLFHSKELCMKDVKNAISTFVYSWHFNYNRCSGNNLLTSFMFRIFAHKRVRNRKKNPFLNKNSTKEQSTKAEELQHTLRIPLFCISMHIASQQEQYI